MFHDFDRMPMQSRVWVYQANRPLTAKEENMIMYSLKNSLNTWNAHGEPLLGSVRIDEGRFVIVAVDESHNGPSGCSIDASTHWLKDLGTELNVDFFDRSLAYIKDNEILTVPVFGLKKAVENGLLLADTVIFNNNSVQTKSQLVSSWKMAASKSPFLSKYFNKQVA